jgi:endonuclease YncB( thermonuclease family)
MAAVLLEAGLAKLHPFFSTEKTVDGHLLIQAEENARKQRLKVCFFTSSIVSLCTK